jgi:hypothetical protein
MATAPPVTIVLGYQSSLASRYLGDALRAGLTETVATVLPTYRDGQPDAYLDHETWVACAHAVGAVVRADESEVLVDAEPGFLDNLLRRTPSRPFGSFEPYAALLTRDPDAPLWQQVLWRRSGVPVAAAVHEAWWRVGGPELYHDSYTSCFLVPSSAVADVVTAIRSALDTRSVAIDRVVDLRSTDAGAA